MNTYDEYCAALVSNFDLISEAVNSVKLNGVKVVLAEDFVQNGWFCVHFESGNYAQLQVDDTEINICRYREYDSVDSDEELIVDQIVAILNNFIASRRKQFD